MAQQTTGTPAAPDGSVGAGVLKTSQGRTSIADSVVEKIAGIAAREVAGIHDMGTGVARTFGAIKDKMTVSGGSSPSQGVKVDVGEEQAAVDLDVIVEYGVSIPDVAGSVRQNVIQRVERMTGLQVTEVNITVGDVFLGDDEEPDEPRVQ